MAEPVRQLRLTAPRVVSGGEAAKRAIYMSMPPLTANTWPVM